MAEVPEPLQTSAPGGPEPGPPPVPEPPAIAALAARHGLGAYRHGRTVVAPASIARVGALAAVPAVAVFALGAALDIGLVAFVGFLAILLALTILAYAVKTAVTGGDNWYLYDGGLVAVNRRRPRVVPWSAVASVRRERMGKRVRRRGMAGMTPDTVRGYRLVLQDGSGVFVFSPDVAGVGRRLRADLEQLARATGLPIEG
jgi:hypothetical protein